MKWKANAESNHHVLTPRQTLELHKVRQIQQRVLLALSLLLEFLEATTQKTFVENSEGTSTDTTYCFMFYREKECTTVKCHFVLFKSGFL